MYIFSKSERKAGRFGIRRLQRIGTGNANFLALPFWWKYPHPGQAASLGREYTDVVLTDWLFLRKICDAQ